YILFRRRRRIMQPWIPIAVLAITIINSWVLKWVDLSNKIPTTKESVTKSSVYAKNYKTGIVIVALLGSVSTLAYLMFSALPVSKVTVLLIALNVSAVFMAV